jgi:WD40 repeat protein
LLQGHERSLTQVVFNPDGDLLFSTSKDHVVNAWYSHNGERLGTYNGHIGAVWTVHVNCKSPSPFSRHPVVGPNSFSNNDIIGYRQRRQYDEAMAGARRNMSLYLELPHRCQTCRILSGWHKVTLCHIAADGPFRVGQCVCYP